IAIPAVPQSSSTAARVTPGKIPLGNGGVQTVSPRIQNRLLVEPSTTCPSEFSNTASSAFSASASARASTCGNLFKFLKRARGSPAGKRKDEIETRQAGGFEGSAASMGYVAI